MMQVHLLIETSTEVEKTYNFSDIIKLIPNLRLKNKILYQSEKE